MAKITNLGRVKGNIWYTGNNLNEVTKPFEGDIFLNTTNKKIYQFKSGNWVEISQLPINVSDLINDKKYATEDYVNDILSNFSSLDLKTVDSLPTSNISTTSIYLLKVNGDVNNIYEEYIYVNNKWELIGNTKVDLSDYAKISDVPTKVSELENDKGYLTQHQDLGAYAKKTELFSKNYNDLNNKPNIPSKLSDLEIDVEVGGGVSEEEVLSIIEENSEAVDENFSVVTSSNYKSNSDSEIPTTNVVNNMLSPYAKKTELFSKSYNDLTDKPTIPSTTNQLTNNSGYITKAVSDLTNYYKKSETYTQTEINNLVSALPKFAIEVVDTLPTSNISNQTIYLKTITGESPNLYEEYIYVNGTWELLGSQTVDLTDYATKTNVVEIIDDNSENATDIEIGTSDTFDSNSDNQIPTTKAVAQMIDDVVGNITSLLEAI